MARLMTRAEYLSQAGDRAGWGFGSTFDGAPAWGAEKEKKLVDCFESALRNFYEAHDWSFMRPLTRVTLREGEKTIELPPVSGIEGKKISVRNTDNTTGYCTIEIVNPFKVADLHNQTPNQTGVPMVASLQSSKGPGNRGQQFACTVFPTADQDYVLEFPGYVNPEMPDDQHPYPWGSEEHVETILEMVFAMVEERILYMKGISCSNVPPRLQKSIEMDRRKEQKSTGTMVDAMGYRESPAKRHLPYAGMTFDGVLYED